MTRHDVANLVFRIFALWLGVMGVAQLVALPWVARVPETEPLLTALILAVPPAAGVVLWLLAGALARMAFDRPDDAVPYGITRDDVPPLACFVVSLVVLAGAVPQTVSWLAMQMVRTQADSSLMNPDLLPRLDQQSAGTGSEILARLVAGAVLLATSRRRGLWSAPAADSSLNG
jgi:hypothetical protein